MIVSYPSQTLFIESACDDERIIEENVRSVKISSPDVSHPDSRSSSGADRS